MRVAHFNAIRRDWRPLFGWREAPRLGALWPALGRVLSLAVALFYLCSRWKQAAESEWRQQPNRSRSTWPTKSALHREINCAGHRTKGRRCTCDNVSLVTCRNTVTSAHLSHWRHCAPAGLTNSTRAEHNGRTVRLSKRNCHLVGHTMRPEVSM